MLRTLPGKRYLHWMHRAYLGLFLAYLATPLLVVAVFAFNDSGIPSLPWRGATLDWFIGNGSSRTGMLFDREIAVSMGHSLFVALLVSVLSIICGTTTAFLFERYEFRGKRFLYLLMLVPLVIPGVILGIAILAFSSTLANGLEAYFDLSVDALRPGLALVVLGQFSFIATIATLVISARLRKFDRSLEEAALNLGASPVTVLRTITLPFLYPTLVGCGLVAFLMSFENFSTTLMLVGSDAPLMITMFNRMRQGSTPELNAVSLALMLGSALLGLAGILAQRSRPGEQNE
ncbi:ABC transporter permease [Verminephrobacter aporrectodeae]|uniref:ABC transporter permease n=1 Tax=Verminephrobacter aporrectodeae subsp. tuberculatae TaxID=1110392 RepID=A0ABT3KXB6_9BURK|nr:ABC transporter permease [Verminephrobacter aporrectodeae]MCW5322983.1 ABC transporter permease [Verminephrobacter aporrectodeae subsp. tuberculatae]MCW8176705.1 ABC transporter permease [Verminephrobacter aporrectodeae subsp. tuberculatae]MCW8204308.1 ABC transporter permease [Verminephrobacter aporrectodeae subsp. tuberculatae]MCW8207763.1 ABC transporter permease [Verminephrobacter aporrectodeae subsp. tuberculatae]